MKVARRFDVVLSFSLASHLDVALAGRLAVGPPSSRWSPHQAGPGRRCSGLRRESPRRRWSTAQRQPATWTATHIGPWSFARASTPNGSDRTRATRRCGHRSAPGRQQLVGIVGRVDEGKGVEVLLEAMACDTGPVSDAHLAIVGDVGVMDDGFLDRVKRRAAELLGTRSPSPGAVPTSRR